MPIKAVPNAPIPVHTAYAVPSGIDFKLIDNAVKLSTAKTKKVTVGQTFVKFSESFKKVVKQISKIPAKRR